MASIFTKIVEGEIPAYKVAEDEHFLAFLDIFPIKEGHLLVIPKTEVDYLFDLDRETYLGLWEFADKVAKGLKKAVPCKRVGVAVLGMEVPHAHIHLIPLHRESDLSFSNPKLSFSKEEFEEIANRIRREL